MILGQFIRKAEGRRRQEGMCRINIVIYIKSENAGLPKEMSLAKDCSSSILEEIRLSTFSPGMIDIRGERKDLRG